MNKDISNDWGLGIEDWELDKSPIPNPQSPNCLLTINKYIYVNYKVK